MTGKPTFAFVAIGAGSCRGSTVRDLTLANRLHRRGFKVVVYWLLAANDELVEPGIGQRLLCHASRYRRGRPSAGLEGLIRLLPRVLRQLLVRGEGEGGEHLLVHLVRALIETPEGDAGLARRLNAFIVRDEVSLLMPACASLGPLALAARRLGGRPFNYALTFQDDVRLAGYVRRAGLFERYRGCLLEALQGSPWPALAASRDGLYRVSEELDIALGRLKLLHSGVEVHRLTFRPPLWMLKNSFPALIDDLPIVTCLGRQDVNRGLDLLLYALKQLKTRGIEVQLVVGGDTPGDDACRKVIADLAERLGIVLHQADALPHRVRDLLFAHSYCLVHPGAGQEASGLMVAEAMSQGTPVLVPDQSGLAELVCDGNKAGGMVFRNWDSGDLACQLGHLLANRVLHRELARNARLLAARFSADGMVERVLQHLGVPPVAQNSDSNGVPSAVVR